MLGRRLVLWALLSVVGGLVLLAWGGPFERGVGAMFVAWGAVDGVLGVAVRRLGGRARRRARGDAEAPARQARRIRRLLVANAALDVGYIAGGLWLALGGPVAAPDPFAAGAGWGIVVQGAFLLAFDVLHARHVPPPTPILPPDLALFTGPEHEGFRLSAVRPAPATSEERRPTVAPSAPADAAILVHGFGGTPAELRGLAAVLAADGWVVEVPLLPGMGAAIRELPDVTARDWLDAVETAAARLRRGQPRGGRLLVVGHSMGAALALATADRLGPDGIVLMAPFWWPEPAWIRPVAPLVRTLLPPGIRPFRRMDLDGRDLRQGLGSVLPGMNLDDPEVRRSVRDLTVPISIFDQLFRVSRAARHAARRVRAPVLVLQGRDDEVARPARTRRLVATMPGPPPLLELEGGHGLVTEDAPARDEALAAILAFSRSLRAAGGRVATRPAGDS